MRNFWDGQAAASFSGIGDIVIPKDQQQFLDEDGNDVAPPNPQANPIYKGKLHYTETAILDGDVARPNRLLSINRYETFGRLDRVQSDNHLGGFDNNLLYYDYADNLVRTLRFHSQTDNISDFVTQTRQKYDHQGRKVEQDHLKTGFISQQLCSLEYDVKDLLKVKHLGGIQGGGFLQKIDFNYLPNRFLKGINETMSATDLFSLQIGYDQAIPSLSAAQYDGNIASLTWQVKGSVAKTYGYQYDFNNRLTAANYNLNSNAYGTTYGYDARGNFTSITRRGLYSNEINATSVQIDNLIFSQYAKSNKVKTIMDNAPCPETKTIHQALDNTQLHASQQTITADNTVNANSNITYQAGTEIVLKAGFHAKAGTNFVAKIADCPQDGFETAGFVQRSNNDYLYDANGNQTRDPNKGITTEYNYLNLPHKTTFDSGNVLEWLYLGDGTKVQKLAKQGSTTILQQDYISSFEYRNDTLEAIYVEGGRLLIEDGVQRYEFQLSDHVSNNRVLFTDDGMGNAIILQNQDFYPYGLSMRGNYIQNAGKEDRYKFNGNELQSDFGLNVYDFVNRQYDPETGRFWQIDALAEQANQVDKSPFAFSWNNPIRFNDPIGLSPDWIDNGDGTYTAEAGDSALSLAEDAGISNSRANSLVESQLGSNYIGADGGLKSNVEVGDVVNTITHEYSWSSGGTGITPLLPSGSSTAASGLSISSSTAAGATADGVGGLGAGLTTQGGSVRLTNGAYNGNGLSPKYYASGWTGGSVAQIKTYNLGTVGRAAGRLGTAGTIGLGVIDVGSNAYNEGGFGAQTQLATGRFAGSLSGGAAGAALGANFFGIGAIPGGIVGGIIGGYGGSKAGEKVVETIQNKN
ncbi:MAG: 3-coathanger stack domain-containing protein [Bacteroidota bacterium]